MYPREVSDIDHFTSIICIMFVVLKAVYDHVIY